ncbi:MAG: phospholipase [Leptothrix sp. (in: Bacteria)]|nr:phospholipase [Leptothrix sp. (in: b-proteobacteria)]
MRGAACLARCAGALAALLLGGCAVLAPAPPSAASYALADAQDSALGRRTAALAQANDDRSGLHILATGREALLARGALAERAERTLDLQYFSVAGDASTELLLARLMDAAERGVRVRVLLDDIEPTARTFAASAAAAHPGIEARLFNPFRSLATSSLSRLGEWVIDNKRLNVRMHNKAWIADNAMAVFGSRNLGDAYFDLDEAAGFTDLDLLVVGPAVREMSAAFDRYWNSTAAVPIAGVVGAPRAQERELTRQALRQRLAACADGVADTANAVCQRRGEGAWLDKLRSAEPPLRWARVHFTADPPLAEKTGIESGILHFYVANGANGALTQSELLIVSPYFVPDDDGVAHLAKMRERGVRVVVLTNSLASTDSVAAHAGYASRRLQLLRAGVELHEFRPQPGLRHNRSHRWGQASPASLHTKLVVQDRQRVVVGSANQDPRSRLHNTESWLIVDNRDLAEELALHVEEGTDLLHSFRAQRHVSDAGRESVNWVTMDDGQEVLFDSEPLTSVWRRVWRSLLAVLIPEHML